MLKTIAMFLLALAAVFCQHPKDFEYYHILHLPHDPPLYPVFERAPPTRFTCQGRSRGYYADVDSGCQAFHFCWRHRIITTDLCSNGTLFNEQFQPVTSHSWAKTFFSMQEKDWNLIHHASQQGLTNIFPTMSQNQNPKQVCDHFYNVRCGSPYEDL